MKVINEYYLKPKGTQKSFSRKAIVKEYEEETGQV